MHKKILLIVILAGAGMFGVYSLSQPRVAPADLEKFVQLTTADPLFYSPFFEGEAFRHSIDSLKASEARLKATAIKNIKADNAPYSETFAGILEQHPLFPLAFLEALPSVSEATDTFLENPTARNAQTLLKTYERASKAYSDAAKSNVEVFAKIASYTKSDLFCTSSLTALLGLVSLQRITI
jgi:hypothetical protein